MTYDAEQQSAFNSAIINGNAGKVQQLLATGKIDPAANKNCAIELAAEYGHLEIVKILVELKDKNGNPICDPAANNNSPIKMAAKKGHLHIVKYLANLRGNKNDKFICKLMNLIEQTVNYKYSSKIICMGPIGYSTISNAIT